MTESLKKVVASGHWQDVDPSVIARLNASDPVDREAEFVIGPTTPREVNDAISLEFGLVESLGRAQAWLLDNILTPGVPVIATINDQFNPTDLPSLQAKLAQYPSDTVLHLSGFGAPDRLAAVSRAIHETASQNGLIIEDQPMR